ncbi:hypothetical protein AVEN_252309-1 [Araneus ventricosus]|uniref:Uncharacterized protein n=1 Tax=Araneus ventricosus TaxID=182803 RepID=A0A4Y2DR93_ARAVE|nr:hypothetical protein AVEN_252309-1 [Araneus ventricosus]
MRWRIWLTFKTQLSCRNYMSGRGGLVVRSRLQGQMFLGSKPDSTEDPPCIWDWRTLNLMLWVKRPPIGVVLKFGESCQLGCCSHHMTTVYKYEVSPKLALQFLNSLMNLSFITIV